MRIGLDIDGVLANFQQGVIELAKKRGLPFYQHWTEWSTRNPPPGPYADTFARLWPEIEGNAAFWLGLEPMHDAFVPFPVACYVTFRPVPSEVSHEWLMEQGFPDAPVITVDSGLKVPTLIEHGIDIFVDDLPRVIEEIMGHDNEIVPLLLDRRYNEHAVHLPRIKYLTQVVEVLVA
jgi:hypothetical protein